MAGCVARWHARPKLRPQSIGEHSWQALRILLAIWPQAPRELMVHAVVHDIGEIVAGDPPFPVKRDNPDLKSISDRIERGAHLAMVLPWGLPAPAELHPIWRAVFKLAESIEMWEDNMQESLLGNEFARVNIEADRERLDEMAEKVRILGEPEVADRACWYMARREKEWMT